MRVIVCAHWNANHIFIGRRFCCWFSSVDIIRTLWCAKDVVSYLWFCIHSHRLFHGCSIFIHIPEVKTTKLADNEAVCVCHFETNDPMPPIFLCAQHTVQSFKYVEIWRLLSWSRPLNAYGTSDIAISGTSCIYVCAWTHYACEQLLRKIYSNMVDTRCLDLWPRGESVIRISNYSWLLLITFEHPSIFRDRYHSSKFGSGQSFFDIRK